MLQRAAELRVLDVASALSRGFMRLFANTWKNALAMQFVVILLSECLPATAQNTAELNTLRDVNKALWSCMKPPRIAYPGMQMTLDLVSTSQGAFKINLGSHILLRHSRGCADGI